MKFCMKKILNSAQVFIACAAMLFVAGCATNGNDAFIQAHKSQSEAMSNVAGAKAKQETERVNAIAEIAKTCQDVGCKAMAMMSITYASQQVQTAAPAAPAVIAAPVNEVTDAIKTVASYALKAYDMRLGLAKFAIDAMRGPSDAGVVIEALDLGGIIRVPAN